MKSGRILTSAITSCLVFLTLSLAMKAFATVTLNLSAAFLNDAGGTPMPTNGLVLLVASINDGTIGTPTSSSFVSGDDTIIEKWDLSTWSTPGLLLDSTGPVSLEGGWNAGDPLQLFWFPTLTITNDRPGAVGIPYGQYRNDAAIDGGDPWITPGEGATISLKFLTQDAGGSNSNSAGNANLVVGEVAAPVILSLTIASATSAVITWSASSNSTYRVQHQPALGAAWSNLEPDITATNNTASAMDNFDGHAQRFYRIQLVQ